MTRRCMVHAIGGLCLLAAVSGWAESGIALQKDDTVVFFGDSITRQGAQSGGYVSLVAEAISECCAEKEIEVIGAGIGGNKVPDLLARLDRDVLSKRPDVVMIYIGINDVWHWFRPHPVTKKKRKGTTPEVYEAGLRALIARIQSAGGDVILCTPTVIGERKDPVNPEFQRLEAYAAICRTVAKDTGVTLLDLRKVFIDYLVAHNTGNVNHGVLTKDGVHLNDAGNRLVARQVCELLEIPFAELPSINSETKIDWPGFMARQDMVWNQVPKRWNEAPFMGNGMIGLFLFQEINNPDNTYSTAEKNVLSLHLGRGDYYDNRAPLGNKPHTWIYRGRLPIGFFRIESKGDVTGVDWRLDLWNARLVGTVKTTEGSYELEGKVHALYDSFYWKVTPAGGESVDFEWQPQKATSYARMVSERAVARGRLDGGEVSHFYKTFAGMPYPEAPEVKVVEFADGNTSRQVLYENSGELVTAWKTIKGPADHSTTLLGTIAFSKEMGVALPKAQKDLARSLAEVKGRTYTQTHRQWWHAYYPRSFVSVSDDFWEQFYWIQMYKLASASRADGMMIDTAGPWYQPGFHPLVWSDLNVQLDYWAQLTANRLDVGKSLMNVMDRNMQNLINNVVPEWRNDCLDADTVFPGNDLIAPVSYKKVADHIVWMLHNYWLFCRYENDTERMRDGLFPLLKRANATYLRYLEDHPLDLGDGKLHFKHTWSPEAATGVDMNYTIALARWSSRILLEINEAHQLNDPKAPEWQNLLDNLVGWQTDANGLRLGKDDPFDHAHRHYSHLLGFYPLYELTPDSDRQLLRTSVDHWLKVSEDPSKVKDQAMPVTGYTCTGAASMYAALGDGNKALEYLRKFTFVNIYSTTLYSEGKEQLIETPLSAASAMHDMLLQSWGGRIRVMPGVPDAWKDIHFRSLLCEGGVVVSADRVRGQLGYAKFESPDVPRTIEFSVPMEDPQFFLINSGEKGRRMQFRKNDEGFYQVSLPANGCLVAITEPAVPGPIKPVKSPGRLKNIFGSNGQYEKVRAQFEAVDLDRSSH